PDFTAVITVDCTRCVDDADPAMQCETAARTDLSFHVSRQGERESCRDQRSPHRLENNGFPRIAQINGCRARGCVGWKRPVCRKIVQTLDTDCDALHCTQSTFSTGV